MQCKQRSGLQCLDSSRVTDANVSVLHFCVWFSDYVKITPRCQRIPGSIAAVVHELTLIDTNRQSSTSGTAVDIGSQSLTCYLTFHL